MRQRYGIMLLDGTELVFRIYEVVDADWKLIHFHCDSLQNTNLEATMIMEKVAAFLTTSHAQHIAEWKIASRHLSHDIVVTVSRAISMKIEPITPDREQELLCKGLFTELW